MMSEQALDLKRSLRIVRRHWIAVSAAAVVGLGAGGAYAVTQPPALSSTALVRVASSQSAYSGSTNATLVVIADSDPVLSLAAPHIQPRPSAVGLQNLITVKSLTSGIISIKAQGRTAAQARATANAVARAFVTYIASPSSLSGSTKALVLQQATIATGRPLPVSIAIFGLLGLLAAAMLAIVVVLALSRRDRRLRLRDEIADSIGLPVLASLPVSRPTDAAGWVKLLSEYKPPAVDGWRLRSALDYLGVGGTGRGGAGQGEGVSVSVLSMASDPAALSLGPQIAAFAASLGISTQLVIGPQQDPDGTATLRAACGGTAGLEPQWSQYLQVTVREDGAIRDQARPALSVLVAVVDGQAPRVPDWMRASIALVGVTAGVATAEELARIAVSSADRGRPISGILVADPEPTDRTTGRQPQLSRATAQRAPTRLTGIPTETRQWMTQSRRP
jgi:capsular polysaccharide biosynthesis protein